MLGTAGFVLIEREGTGLVAGVPCFRLDEDSHPGYEPLSLLASDFLASGGLEDAAEVALLKDAMGSSAAQCRPSMVATCPGRAGGISYSPALTPDERAEAAELAVMTVEAAARDESAPTVCWLYLAEGRDGALERTLRGRGYTEITIAAECYLPITWSGLDEYLSGFRSKHRNKIQREMAALVEAGVEVREAGCDALGPDLAQLEVQWRRKYGRSSSADEVMAEYELLRSCVGDRMRIFVAQQGERTLGFTTFLEDEGRWYAGAGGFDYTVTGLFLYYNLLFYHPIKAAIGSGIFCINYTYASYAAKRSRGCQLRGVMAYMKFPAHVVGRVNPCLRAVDALQRQRFDRISEYRVERK